VAGTISFVWDATTEQLTGVFTGSSTLNSTATIAAADVTAMFEPDAPVVGDIVRFTKGPAPKKDHATQTVPTCVTRGPGTWEFEIANGVAEYEVTVVGPPITVKRKAT
jgi:hypothetical protein